jgi:hypothetical protein
MQFLIDASFCAEKNETRSVQKRSYPSLLWAVNAATGVRILFGGVLEDLKLIGIMDFQILLAIAIPLIIPNRNIFVSYNFEANYNMANIPTDSYGFAWYRVSFMMNF